MKGDLSPIDLSILAQLQKDAKLSSADVAAGLSISVTPTWRRIKRLEELGVIRAYRAELSPSLLGYGVEAFVTVNVALHDERGFQQFEAAVLSTEAIVSCHVISGTGDYLLRVITTNMESYAHFITRQANKLPGVKEIRSAMVLKALKEYRGLPLPSSGVPHDKLESYGT